MFSDYGVVNFWTYLLGAIFIVLAPGPNTFFVLKSSVAHGIKKGYLAAAGVFIGDAVLMFMAYAGVATLIKTSPMLFNMVRYLGAVYLLYLGGKMLYASLREKGKAGAQGEEPGRAIFKRALVLSLTNPKAILFYVSFFVQFVDVSAGHPATAFLILALVLEMVSAVYLSVLIFSGAFVTHYIRTKTRLAKVGNSLIGLIFVGFAARLATLQS